MSVSGYRGAHAAVSAARGPASLHQCRWCLMDAEQWAYDHTDENALYRTPNGSAYSLDVSRYFPLCKRCHKHFDRLHREGADSEKLNAALSAARNRYPREQVEFNADRRAEYLSTFITGKRRRSGILIEQLVTRRVMR